jgi:hypothetical protein
MGGLRLADPLQPPRQAKNVAFECQWDIQVAAVGLTPATATKSAGIRRVRVWPILQRP